MPPVLPLNQERPEDFHPDCHFRQLPRAANAYNLWYECWDKGV